ncbi:ArgC Acetylglutamate semialdehyde dehydrogenase [Burkholderiales bacterium]
MTTKHLVYVDGQEGTTGLRIHSMLAGRADLEVLSIDPDKRKDPAERARLLNEADVSFLCLPDDAAREAASLVTNPKARLIDASTAHRTHPQWAYGLPELALGHRKLIAQSRRVSNPGCHATAFILLVRPLMDAGLLPPDLTLSATSITGYSGGGNKMIEAYEAGGDAELDAPRPYALGLAHKHLPEMTLHSHLNATPVFMPIVGPFLQGLTVSIPLDLTVLGSAMSGESLHKGLAEHYEHETFVRVMPLRDPETLAHGFFDTQRCNGTNRADLFVFANEKQAILMACLDNLGKGASGAAVQNMNLMLGCEEMAGLSV